MTKVFVHGNPETAAIWGPLIAELARDDVVTVSPPGFGAPMPDGFEATADQYLSWLVAELEEMGRPVDLVGHDWGANHVLRLACERPDLLHSWCADTGSWAPDFVWHEITTIWRTPGAGEKAIAAWLDMGVAGRAALNASMGMTPEWAEPLAQAFDATMGRCILALYRSADETAFAQWRELLPAASARPGLVLAPTGDDFAGTEPQYRWTAAQAGARISVLHGLGHWWMLQAPAVGAEALRRFWGSLSA